MNCRSRGWFLGDLELNIRSKGNIGCHVTMSRVPTSRRRNDVTPGQQKKVNKRPNVATSQRHDVATLQRHHYFCTRIIKCKGRPNFEGIEERTDENTESRATVTGIIREDTSFCISSFMQTKLLMISRLIMCILKSSMF